ncbi:uncharacterized protein LOC121404365 [Drosophila obscura]|uniref:uncharacterized protein LOC121404365 n=1 Tax=Drosophila obscura TaxID=7282 RepID=UPI001BB125C0|nr:uncharacterized protein LOC121404365 [Drosophila obscura]
MALICSAKKCEFGGTINGDSYLSCWLCDNYAHIKCAGGGHFGRLNDLISKRMGLTWSCLACREIEAEMRTFMRQTRNGFQDVRKQFNALNEKFLTLESQFLGLKLLSESPRRKILNNNLLLVLPSGTPASHLQPMDSFSTPSGQPSPMDVHPPSEDPAFLTPNNIVVASKIHTPVNLTLDSVASDGIPNSNQLPVANDLPVSVTLNGDGSAASSSSSAPALRLLGVAPPTRFSGVPLSAVVPRKAIFVSRLIPEDTPDDVKLHLSSYLQSPPDNFIITKFNFTHKRNISSFKILLPDSLVSKALEPAAWPEHTIMHEFLPRDSTQNPRVTLPKISKN